MKVKVTEAAKWHVKADIIDENPAFEKVSEDYFAKPAKIQVDPIEEKKEEKIEEQIEQPSMDRVLIAKDDDDNERRKKQVIIVGLILIIIGLLMIKF